MILLWVRLLSSSGLIINLRVKSQIDTVRLWGQSPQANKRLWGQSPQANKRDLLEIVSAPIHSVDNQWLDVKGVGLHFSKSM
jgi:hypothetical protein